MRESEINRQTHDKVTHIQIFIFIIIPINSFFKCKKYSWSSKMYHFRNMCENWKICFAMKKKIIISISYISYFFIQYNVHPPFSHFYSQNSVFHIFYNIILYSISLFHHKKVLKYMRNYFICDVNQKTPFQFANVEIFPSRCEKIFLFFFCDFSRKVFYFDQSILYGWDKGTTSFGET